MTDLLRFPPTHPAQNEFHNSGAIQTLVASLIQHIIYQFQALPMTFWLTR